ncbi:MAG: hypothetical protein D6761_01055 [Candidatus Dadabacteria bacterium]|nr:MAG: hypothetical protein D6761_01055 [Candidatus Dadabacteria bacterium]
MSGERPALDDLEPVPPRSLSCGQLFLSRLGLDRDAPQYPLIIFGHDALDTAAFFAHASTLCTLAVNSLEQIRDAAGQVSAIGIFAMSPADEPGAAAEAIATFRDAFQGPALYLYGSWTTDPEQAVHHAIAAGAHGVIMPDTDVQEMFGYIYALLEAIGEERPLPASERELLDHLRVAFPGSPFWQQIEEREPAVW